MRGSRAKIITSMSAACTACTWGKVLVGDKGLAPEQVNAFHQAAMRHAKDHQHDVRETETSLYYGVRP